MEGHYSMMSQMFTVAGDLFQLWFLALGVLEA